MGVALDASQLTASDRDEMTRFQLRLFPFALRITSPSNSGASSVSKIFVTSCPEGSNTDCKFGALSVNETKRATIWTAWANLVLTDNSYCR
jgi:hypothetical protein